MNPLLQREHEWSHVSNVRSVQASPESEKSVKPTNCIGTHAENSSAAPVVAW